MISYTFLLITAVIVLLRHKHTISSSSIHIACEDEIASPIQTWYETTDLLKEAEDEMIPKFQFENIILTCQPVAVIVLPVQPVQVTNDTMYFNEMKPENESDLDWRIKALFISYIYIFIGVVLNTNDELLILMFLFHFIHILDGS